MYLIIKIIVFIFAGVISYRSVLTGLVLLLVSSCTFGFIGELLAISLPTGSISIGEPIILVLFLKTIVTLPPNSRDKTFRLCFAMVIWLSISAILALIFEQIGYREAYRLVFKIAPFWILPITVRELELQRKRLLLTFSLLLAGILSIVLLYAILTENISLLSYIYPINTAEIYGYGGVDAQYAAIYRSGLLPRLYIPGNLFVKMIFGFTICLLAMHRVDYNRYLLLGVALLSGMFTLSLGGRSDYLFVIVVLVCTIFLALASKSEQFNTKSPWFFGVMLFLLVFGTIETGTWIKETELTHRIDRWKLTAYGFDQNVRIDDTIEAWGSLLRSPLWGIGSPKIYWEATMKTYGGQDIHPFVAQGLIGGFPAIIMLLYFVFMLYKALRMHLSTTSSTQHYYYAVAAAPALAGAFMLSAINTTPVFLFSTVQVPLGIFSGLLLYIDPEANE